MSGREEKCVLLVRKLEGQRLFESLRHRLILKQILKN
jgi:hypothetical protein